MTFAEARVDPASPARARFPAIIGRATDPLTIGASPRGYAISEQRLIEPFPCNLTFSLLAATAWSDVTAANEQPDAPRRPVSDDVVADGAPPEEQMAMLQSVQLSAD